MIPDHKMIHQFDIQYLPCLHQLLRYRDIFW